MPAPLAPTLPETIAQLASTLSAPSPRSARVFADARARHAALAPHASPAEVLAALALTSALEVYERDAIVIALVSEHQRAPHPLWHTLLVSAFAPMLIRLRKRVARQRDEDLDQRVLVAFLGAVRSVRVGTFTTLALRWATEGEVFDAIRAERRRPEMVAFDEEVHVRPFGGDALEKAAAAEVVRMLEETEGAELLDVLLADQGGESLRAYVERTYAGCSEEARAAAYYRLRMARTRVVTELRARLSTRAA